MKWTVEEGGVICNWTAAGSVRYCAHQPQTEPPPIYKLLLYSLLSTLYISFNYQENSWVPMRVVFAYHFTPILFHKIACLQYFMFAIHKMAHYLLTKYIL